MCEPTVAIDYVTITGRDVVGQDGMFAHACDWMDELETYYKRRDWKLLHYAGQNCGPLSLGFAGDDSFIIQMSGEAARDALIRIPEIAGLHASRVDFQITFENAHRLFVEDAYNRLEVQNAVATRKRYLRYIQGNGGSTLYVNKRTGPVFLRLYDKGAEQGGQAGILYRAEVEFKKDKADIAWKLFVNAENRTELVKSVVISEFQSRGIEIPVGSVQLVAVKAARKEPYHDKQLKWLRRSVRPAIDRLVSAGLEAEVRRVLFGDMDELDENWSET